MPFGFRRKVLRGGWRPEWAAIPGDGCKAGREVHIIQRRPARGRFTSCRL
ncbi:hypothetical protein AB395_00004721 (plasmid) [Sinorhizobium fredii CCBAU 45436]|nr:hypothetical protein AB395_00004721 [Sinorhizobium fredii CCBAU 45436]